MDGRQRLFQKIFGNETIFYRVGRMADKWNVKYGWKLNFNFNRMNVWYLECSLFFGVYVDVDRSYFQSHWNFLPNNCELCIRKTCHRVKSMGHMDEFKTKISHCNCRLLHVMLCNDASAFICAHYCYANIEMRLRGERERIRAPSQFYGFNDKIAF